MRFTYIYLLYCFLFSQNVYAQTSIYDVQSPKREVRAVWIATIGGIDWPRNKSNGTVSSIERQQRELCDQLDRLQRIHINTVLLQTRVRGSVIYPSDIEPWDECLTGHYDQHPGYDPLQFAIEECHKRGMELHAWVVTIPLGKTERLRKQVTKSILHQHPQLCKSAKGESFMKPGHPETADYVAALCREIAEKYDVDGISLDYIRYPEKEYNFSDDELFSQEEKNLFTRSEWRRANITRIVKSVHDSVKPLKPWVKLSSSPLGRYDNLSCYSSAGWDCYNAVYQDPRLWLENNYQDMLFPMMYFQGNLFYPFLFNWKEISCGHPVVSGLGIYFLDRREKNWPLRTITQEMSVARQSGVGGTCFYRSMYLLQNIKGLYSECERFFSRPALPVCMTWMDNCPTPSMPTDLSVCEDVLSWAGIDSVLYNVYASNEYPVDTDDANNLIATSLREHTFVCPESARYKLYYAVTAMNRYGCESAPLQMDVPSVQERKHIEETIKRHFSQPLTTKPTKKRKR